MEKLTKAQRDQLELVATYKVPASDVKRGFPAVRDSYFDGRVLPGLHRMGLVDCFVHEWWDSIEERKRYTVLVQITEAGRTALTRSNKDDRHD